MKAALLETLLELDFFGSSISLNYQGRTNYKTKLGSFFTIGLATFIIAFGLFSLIDIYEYQNPQITQYTIFEKREDSNDLNFGQMLGNIIFGF